MDQASSEYEALKQRIADLELCVAGTQEDLAILAQIAVDFVQLPPTSNIYQFITQRLKDVSGGYIVGVSSFSETSQSFCLQGLLGVDQHSDTLRTILGREPLGLSVPICDEARSGLSSGRVEHLPGGLFQLFSGSLPQQTCMEMESVLQLGNTYAMGFACNGSVFGSAFVLTKKGTELMNKGMVEVFMSQAAVALQRRQAEEALRAVQTNMEKTIETRTAQLKELNRELRNEIRARKRTEEELRKSEANYAALVEQARDGLLIVQDGVYRFVNNAFAQISGYSTEEITGLANFTGLVAPDSRELIATLYETRMSGQRVPPVFETQLLCKDESIKEVEVSAGLINYDDRPAILGLVRDVTERHQAEELLRTSFLSSPIGMYIVQDGKLRAVNSSLERFLGLRQHELLGKDPTRFVMASDRKGVRDAAISMLKGQASSPYEFRYLTADGSFRWAMGTVTSIVYQGRRAALGNLIDVHELKKAEEALQESERRYRLLADNVGDVLWVIDLETLRPTYLSPSITRLLGYSVEEAMDRTMEESLTPASVQMARAGLAGTDLANYPGHLKGRIIELEMNHKDGHTVWAEVRVSFLRDSEGRTAGMVGVARDITQRKQAEGLLSTAFTSSPIGLYILQDGKFRFINASFERLLGYRHGSLIGMESMSVVYPDDRTLVKKNAVRMLKGKRAAPYEFRYVTKSGKVKWVMETVTSILYQGRRATLGNFMDVTELKHTEKALEEQERWFRSIYAESPIGIQIRDARGKLIGANKACFSMFGLSEAEDGVVLGKWYGLFEDPNIPQQVKNKLQRGEIARSELIIESRRITGTEDRATGLYIDALITPLTLHEGGPLKGYLVQLQDITERKRSEAERKELEQKAHLASRLATVGMMAAGIAHEINNPLTGVVGFTQLLMQRELPDDVRTEVEIINESAQRVAGIVRGLLTFARQQKPERRQVDINDIIKTNLNLRAYEMETNKIEVEKHLAPDLPSTMADSSQLQQLFLNILINAETEMKLAHGKGRLSIKTGCKKGMIKVTVEDDGPGIPQENLYRIFDPFFTTREVGQGTGLGLSICHTIVTQHSGRIYADSQPGKGTTFVVELPVCSLAEEVDNIETHPAGAESVEPARVLVVDDEPSVLQFLSRALAIDGHKVDTAATAWEAIMRLEECPYSLVMLDIKLPDIGGAELHERIRNIRPDMPQIVFITGDVMGTDTRDFLAKIGVPHITKPFDAISLRKEVNRALAGKRPDPNDGKAALS